MESKLESALYLARKGFYVFPVTAGAKTPRIRKFHEEATRDEARIKEWWTKWPYCNIGISTTDYGDGESLLVVDVDNKKGKKGDDEILKLEIEGFDFPPTYTQLTPTGGRHFVYRTQHAVKQGGSVFGPGLDIRARGGFIVAAGSDIGGGAYVGDDNGVSYAPEWMVKRCGDGEGERGSFAGSDGASTTAKAVALERARDYVNRAPLAIEGQNGDETTFKVVCALKDFGLEAKEVFDLLSAPSGWNDNCEPPWSPEDLSTKIRNAYAYGRAVVGSAAPEKQFSALPETPALVSELAEGEFYLDKMNSEYALIYMEGNHFILHETIDEKGFPKRVFLTEASFKRRFSPFTVQSGKGRQVTWAEEWLDWEGRREYAGVCFTPGRAPRHNYYNLWRGFTQKPIPYQTAENAARRGFDAFMEHSLQNVCGGDPILNAWLLGYFAHMVQRPYERPLTTLVFRGEKGTGKNALIDRVGRLLGPTHYLVAHDGRYLTSNFNGHLDSCLCLVLDEAFWSGDKSAEGKLKGLTTAPEILIERKGKEPYSVDNLVRLVVIGNEDWLVPASFDERRYAVFDIGNGRKQDNEFFERLRIDMDQNGGCGVLLDYLTKYDLSQIDVNRAPATAGLRDQKIASQEPIFDWWLDSLAEGRILCSDIESVWGQPVEKHRFRDAYARYSRERNIKGRLPSAHMFGRLLAKCCPSLKMNHSKREGDRVVSCYFMPHLAQARKDWDAMVGHQTDWGNAR